MNKYISRQALIAILRWSEKYTRTDMVYLAHGGFWLIVGQGLTFLASVSLVWLFANMLSQETYGEYRFILAYSSILALTTLPGMSQAIARAVTQNKTGTIYRAIKEKLAWGLLGTSGSLAICGYYLLNNDHRLAAMFLIVAIFIPFFETFGDYQSYLQGKFDFRRQSLYRALQRAIVVLLIGSLLLYSQNIYILIVTFFVVTISTNIFFFVRTLKLYAPNQINSNEDISYGKRLSLLSAFRMAAQYSDKVLLFHFIGPAQLAIYVFATALPQEISSVFSHINNLAFPKMVNRNSDELKKTLPIKVLIYTFILCAVVAMYIFISPLLFKIFFPQYLDSIPYTQLFSLTLLFLPTGVLMQKFYAHKNLKVLAVLNVIEPIILIALYLILIPFFGIYGVIYSMLLKLSINATMLIYLFLRH